MGKTAGFIYARSDSSRLPGKIFSRINDMSLLEIVFLRAKLTNLDEIYLVTSYRSVDDELSSFAEKHGIDVIRGDGNNVISRTLRAIKETGAQCFARINGDSPLLDPVLVNMGLSLAPRSSFVSNLFCRRSPYGISLELINSDFFEASVEDAPAMVDIEHITRHIYGTLPAKGIMSISNDFDHSHLSYVIDEPEHLSKMKDDLIGRDPVSVGYWELEGCKKPSYSISQMDD